MKLYDKKRIIIISFSIILGLALSIYLFFEQIGTIGRKEIIILLITDLILVSILLIMIKKGNK